MTVHTTRAHRPTPERQEATVAAIRHHHAALARTMADHALTIRRSIDQLASQSTRRDLLVTFCRDELLPHAVAEERTLYQAAAGLPETRLLVDAMTREHVTLRGLVDALDAARTPGETLGAAAALDALFHAHLEKENDLLLPALVEAGVDLETLLAGMHDLIGGHHPDHADHDAGHADHTGHADQGGQGGQGGVPAVDVEPSEISDTAASGAAHECACGGRCHSGGEDYADAAVHVADGELDVRALAPAQRHEQIFAAFRSLSQGTAFVFVNDHDPASLRYQFAAEHPGEFEWDYLEAGPQVWRVRIGRP